MNRSLGRHGFSGYICILFASIGLFILLQRKNPDVTSMTAEEVAQLLRRDTSVVLLDVRTEDEWNGSTGHLKNAILIPYQDLHRHMNRLDQFRDRVIVVYCRSGNRSVRAARLLTDSGYNTVNLAGGIRGWSGRKYSVSLEKLE